jgi:hypothetical protein
MRELFQAWRPLFSKKVDYESKFLFKIAMALYNEVDNYQRALDVVLFPCVNKANGELNFEKKQIAEIEVRIGEKADLFANAIEKFILDMNKEVFEGLYKKEDEQRLFSLEIENLKNGDKFDILTECGIERKKYKKTDFQEEFGSMLGKR